MTLIPGTKLGSYEIKDSIGSGGMGEVYRAHDSKLDRDVAVKVLPDHLAQDPGALKRFESEAKAVAALAHPNILAIYDLGNEAGIRFIVTELLEGATLRSVMDAGRIPIRKAVEYGLQISHGLAATHEKGIIHRDLKPKNIFVRQSGRITILDYGLAKRKTAGRGEESTWSGETEPGVVIGTMGYISPEQVRTQDADHRSDIFSLGVILYEMLSGRCVFKRDSPADTMSAILNDYPTSLATEGISPQLEELVLRCLEKKPTERFQSARDLGFSLQSILDLKQERSVSAEATGPSIAVLPFSDMSPGKDQDYFCEGMAEEIINALANIKGLHVAARTSSFYFKGKSEDIRQIGTALNVGTLLEGSVRTAGSRLRVTAQLVNVEDGYHLWSKRYDRKMEDVFDIQDEISQSIVYALKSKLFGDADIRLEAPKIFSRYKILEKLGSGGMGEVYRGVEIGGHDVHGDDSSTGLKSIRELRPTKNLEAYQSYLKGRYFRFTKYDNQRALQFFEQAARIDPSYSEPFIGMADCYNALGFYGYIRPEIALQKANGSSNKAATLAGSMDDVHGIRGFIQGFFEWNWSSAEQSFKQSLILRPGVTATYSWYAILLACIGRQSEAESMANKAQELDPLSPHAASIAGVVLACGSKLEEAITLLKKTIDIYPDSPHGLLTLGMAYSAAKMFNPSIECFTEGVSVTRRAATWLGMLGYALGKNGQHAQAMEIIRELENRAEREYVTITSIAHVLIGLDQKDEAMSCLEKAIDVRDPLMTMLRFPYYDTLRSEAKFQELMRRMNLNS